MRVMLKPLLFLGLALSHSMGIADDGYVRLVPSRPSMPPLEPLKSVDSTSIAGSSAELFTDIQPLLVKLGVYLEMLRVEKLALTEAAAAGQAGVLLKTRVAVHQVGMEAYYYPVGSGVSLVGYGPSAEAVVYYQGLNVIEEPVPKGMALDQPSSLYVWVPLIPGNQGKSAYATYDINDLESYVRMVKANALMRKALEEKAKASFIEGYGRMLEATAKSEEDRKVVQVLLQSRAKAMERLKNIEVELNARLERAAKAARAAAMWNTLSAVFSVGSSVALASATTGQKVQTPSGATPKTATELTSALNSLAAETQSLSNAIQQSAEMQRQLINSLQESLLKAGANRGQHIQQPGWQVILH